MGLAFFVSDEYFLNKVIVIVGLQFLFTMVNSNKCEAVNVYNVRNNCSLKLIEYILKKEWDEIFCSKLLKTD